MTKPNLASVDEITTTKAPPAVDLKKSNESKVMLKNDDQKKESTPTIPTKAEGREETKTKEDAVNVKSAKEPEDPLVSGKNEEKEANLSSEVKPQQITAKTETKTTAPAKTTKVPSTNNKTTQESSLPVGNTTHPPGKKRKAINRSGTPPPQTASTTANNLQAPPVISTLADPQIKQIVHDLLALLQLYGPLSHMQLEHNISSISSHKNDDKKSLLNDILELLLTIGIVKRVKTTSDDPSLRLYCVFGQQYPINTKITRPDVILPQQVLPELERAHSQWRHSLERAQTLKNFLKEGGKEKSPRDLLLSMMETYGTEMANDPVYITAMRTFGIHIGGGSSKKKQNNAKRSPAASAKSTPPPPPPPPSSQKSAKK